MGKRSTFERKPRDYYPTPLKAVEPLLPHLQGGARYIEPCAGDGRLIDHLKGLSDLRCIGAYDIDPQVEWVLQKDVFDINLRPDMYITNPPWDRKILHPLIDHLSSLADTWLLFDADWMHTKQSSDYMMKCEKVVSVGRVKWIEGSKNTGKDNCCWYFFPHKEYVKSTTFIGR